MAGRGAMPNGVIFYEGPSLVDGQPIVAIAPFKVSTNGKTGPMLQTYILSQLVDPVTAVQTRDDFSVCGDCKLRGIVRNAKVTGRVCYVDLGKAPLSVWRSWKRGGYEPLEDRHSEWLSWRPIRRGSYGDPSAVPADAWDRLERASQNEGWGTGYTRRWQQDESTMGSCMASVDSPAEREAAKNRGWRTFRVRGPEEPLLPGEVICPASEEGGYKTSCYQCQLCNGIGGFGSRPDVAIIVHGARRGSFSAAGSASS